MNNMVSPNSTPLTFEQKCLQAMEHSLIDLIRKGEWCKIDYGTKFPVTNEFLRKIHSQVDMDRVAELVISRVEERVADNILNSMATEIATDVKQIMCNKELREDIRALIRQKIRDSREALGKS